MSTASRSTPAEFEAGGDTLPFNILYVDDGELECLLLRRKLESMDLPAALFEARSGEEAYEILKRERIGLLITDRHMSDMSGDELCRLVIDEAELGRPYMIMMTADDSLDGLVSGLSAGADAYITKPVEFRELETRIRAGQRIWQLRGLLEFQYQLAQDALYREQEAKARLEEDMRAAALLQQHLLPPSVVTLEATTLAHMYRPATQMGGDMLGYVPIGPHHIGFYLLDVSGHGAASALMSFSVSHALRPTPGHPSMTALPQGPQDELVPVPPDQVLRELNRRYVDDTEAGWYFTMIYGVIDQRSGEAAICQAGHPPPVLLPLRGSPEAIEGGGMPVGLFADAEYTTERFSLKPGDRLFLYSDGLNECTNGAGEELGDSAVMAAMSATRGRNAEEALEVINWIVNTWRGSQPLDDDLSVLAIDFNATAIPPEKPTGDILMNQTDSSVPRQRSTDQ